MRSSSSDAFSSSSIDGGSGGGCSCLSFIDKRFLGCSSSTIGAGGGGVYSSSSFTEVASVPGVVEFDIIDGSFDKSTPGGGGKFNGSMDAVSASSASRIVPLRFGTVASLLSMSIVPLRFGLLP